MSNWPLKDSDGLPAHPHEFNLPGIPRQSSSHSASSEAAVNPALSGLAGASQLNHSNSFLPPRCAWHLYCLQSSGTTVAAFWDPSCSCHINSFIIAFATCLRKHLQPYPVAKATDSNKKERSQKATRRSDVLFFKVHKDQLHYCAAG